MYLRVERLRVAHFIFHRSPHFKRVLLLPGLLYSLLGNWFNLLYIFYFNLISLSNVLVIKNGWRAMTTSRKKGTNCIWPLLREIRHFHLLWGVCSRWSNHNLWCQYLVSVIGCGHTADNRDPAGFLIYWRKLYWRIRYASPHISRVNHHRSRRSSMLKFDCGRWLVASASWKTLVLAPYFVIVINVILILRYYLSVTGEKYYS